MTVTTGNVMEELISSGLREAIQRGSARYVPFLDTVANSAYLSREFYAPKIQIKERRPGSGQQFIIPATADEAIHYLNTVGIVKRIEGGSTPRYRFASYQTFVEIAERLNENKNSQDTPALPARIRD